MQARTPRSQRPAGGARATSTSSPPALPMVRAALSSPAHPLDESTRAFFEPRLGHDFGRVRVHRDTRSARSAEAVSASAYTVGRDVVFAAGRYAPHTAAGRRLIAHELAHVAQQASGPGAQPRLARKQTPWPAWHQQALAAIARVAGPSDGKTADARWPALLPYLCGLSAERAASLHSRLSPASAGLQGGTDDFAVYVKNKFPAHHARLIGMLSETAAGREPGECRSEPEPEAEAPPKPEPAPEPPRAEPPAYRYDPTDPDPHYRYTGEPPVEEPVAIRVTAVDAGELRRDWLDVIEHQYPHVVEMTGVESMVAAVLDRAAGRPIEQLIIIDHGDPYANFVEIGNSFITVEELDLYREPLGRLRGKFAPGARVTFCNCYVGQNSELIAGLSEIFGVPVVATTGEYYYVFGYSTGDWLRCEPSGSCQTE